MQILANNLKRRAKELGLTDTAVARKVGIGRRRYAHYSKGDRNPDHAILVKIAAALLTTPDLLLNVSGPELDDRLQRLLVACKYLDELQIETLTVMAETLASKRNSHLVTSPSRI